MEKKFINLIGYPDFYKTSKVKYYLDLNNIFWDFIFSENLFFFLKEYNINNINKQDLLNLKYILKNIKLAKNIFLLLKKEDIEIFHLIFAFNIIDSYLEILNKNLKYEKILFYDYFKYNNIKDENIEDTLMYYILKKNINEKKIPSEISLRISLSEQLIQLEILFLIFNKNNNISNINISLKGLVLFENKNIFKLKIKKIAQKYININIKFLDFSLKNNGFYSQKILGKYNVKKYIFNGGCNYRKCNFCNIGKFLGKINKEEQDIILSKIIDLHKSGELDILHISDPDILPKEILYISEFFIKNKCDININLKMRFSKDLSLKNLEKMYKGGVRFLGIGLESASARVNKLMNKYEEDFLLTEFDNFIKNCFDIGINLHVYTIFGFPTETKEEIDLTKDFLLRNLKKYSFFSYTAGLFGLNKGSYIYNNPHEFNLKFKEKNVGDETFINEFYEKNIYENKNYCISVVNSLKNQLFFDNKYLFNKSRNFWYFLEHSNLFHVYKNNYKQNPFIKFWNKNPKINIEDQYFHVNEYLQYVKIENEKILIINWLNLKKILVTSEEFNFLKNYNKNKKLHENLSYEKIGKDKVIILIEDYFFIKE